MELLFDDLWAQSGGRMLLALLLLLGSGRCLVRQRVLRVRGSRDRLRLLRQGYREPDRCAYWVADGEADDKPDGRTDDKPDRCADGRADGGANGSRRERDVRGRELGGRNARRKDLELLHLELQEEPGRIVLL